MKTLFASRFTAFVLLGALFLAGIVSYYASSHPDGLEFIAGERGFLDTATTHAAARVSPLADYNVKGIGNARLSGGLAGILGCAVVLVIAMVIDRALRTRRQADGTSAPADS